MSFQEMCKYEKRLPFISWVCSMVSEFNFRIVLHFYYSVSTMSNRLKYLPGLILVVGKAVPLADINKVPLKYSL